nr:monocarboxylate transporter 12-like [Lytechinus pictus]
MNRKVFILLGAWIIQFFEVGTIKSFSVLIRHIAKDIDSTISHIGTLIGIFHAFTVIFGVLANVLLDHFSPRRLCMVGGMIGSAGLMMCSIADTEITIAVFLVISGIGFAMTVLPSQASVISAYGDNYLIPFCVSAMGAGVGMMVLPFCTKNFLEIYEWRGTILLLGGLNLHTVVSGALFKGTLRPRVSQEDKSTRISALLSSQPTVVDKEQDGKIKNPRTSLRQRCITGSWAIISTVYLKSNISMFGQYPLLTYLLIAAYLHGITYAGWTIFVISNAEVKGHPEHNAVFLSFIAGIGNTIGRLLPAILKFLNKDLFSSRISFLLFGFIGSVPLCLNAAATGLPMLGVFASLNGLALGAKAIAKSAASVDVVPDSFSSTALAFTLVCSGMGEVTGGWATGKIWDVTGSLDTAFLFLGFVDILGVIILILSFIHQKIMYIDSMAKGDREY